MSLVIYHFLKRPRDEYIKILHTKLALVLYKDIIWNTAKYYKILILNNKIQKKYITIQQYTLKYNKYNTINTIQHDKNNKLQ